MNWSTFAWRNLWRNKRRTVLTMAMIGVAAFASSLALGYVIATFDAVREGSIDSGVGHVQVLHHGYLDLIGERPLQYGPPPTNRPPRRTRSRRCPASRPPRAASTSTG